MRPCPVCLKNEFTKIIDLHYALFDDLQLSGQMQLVKCNRCNAIYNNTDLQESDFSRYYSINEYYLEAKSAGTGGYSAKDANRYARIYNQIKGYIPSADPTILDFGCGKGGLLSWLKANVQAKGIGIEAGAACREFLQKKQEFPVFGSVSQVAGKVDAIVLSHVLEHVYSPVRLLAELKAISHSDTVFYIEVPRAEAYLAAQLNWHELYFEHINHFTVDILRRLLVSGGLRCREHDAIRFDQDVLEPPDCHYSVATIGKEPAEETSSCFSLKINVEMLPAQEIISNLINNGSLVSIWGISQYTQLVLGTYPELLPRIKYLFDGSSAKIGRTIAGVEIRSSEGLVSLSAHDTLLLPLSPYLEEMEKKLKEIGFSGRIIRF